MNTTLPLRTQENILLSWQDNPEGSDRPYKKDGSILRRHYSALMRDRFGSFGHMSLLVHREPRVAEIEDFSVEEPFRGQGIGKMILRSAVAHLKSQDFQQLSSEEVGATALYVRRSVLGEDMQFYEKNDPERTPLNRTFDEAIRNAYYAERDRKRQTPLPELHVAHGVLLDLNSVDTTGWTLPTAYDYDEYTAAISA